MMDQYIDRQTHPELRPAGARLVSYLHLAFPLLRPFGRLPEARPPGETATPEETSAPGDAATPPEEAAPDGSDR
jgi:hypothetical protein